MKASAPIGIARARGGRALALGWLAAVAALAALGPLLPLAYAPAQPDLAHLATPPLAAGSAHWLGTDPSGRDVLAEMIFGARTAVGISLGAAVLATALGALLGGAAGFWRNHGWRVPWPAWAAALGAGWWALALPGAPAALVGAGLGLAGTLLGGPRWGRRWPVPLDAGVLGATALLGAVPRLVLVVALAGTLPLTPGGLLAVLVLTAWPGPARLVRAAMLRVTAQPFVAAARALGLPAGRVWWRQALPHACLPLRTAFPLSLASLLALESTLSFLGIGLPPEVPSWGHLLGTARTEPTAWWLVAAPGGALLFTILALQYLGRARGPGPAK
ncbi:ABC transporter permease [Hymenobacter caeli]|uniref:Peptide/nickel transport system permease protein n=1 Tax=Hymenobacter caeli TaxID=2735894 RepID=A0ABX2FU80_9BACT|nr:ABC transporter permease subunit [Hymenobacter caeli]NRT20755.1 peptide/nickel transport system permease protein [Hymenobacter caeli]